MRSNNINAESVLFAIYSHADNFQNKLETAINQFRNDLIVAKKLDTKVIEQIKYNGETYCRDRAWQPWTVAWLVVMEGWPEELIKNPDCGPVIYVAMNHAVGDSQYVNLLKKYILKNGSKKDKDLFLSAKNISHILRDIPLPLFNKNGTISRVKKFLKHSFAGKKCLISGDGYFKMGYKCLPVPKIVYPSDIKITSNMIILTVNSYRVRIRTKDLAQAISSNNSGSKFIENLCK